MRLFARSPKGQRAHGARPQKRGKNVSLISAIGLKGLITQVSLIGAIDGLTKALPKSIRRVVEALDHEDARVQIRAAELIAKISGFYQPAAQQGKPDQGSAEQDLKRYLTILEANNGNQHQSVRQ